MVNQEGFYQSRQQNGVRKKQKRTRRLAWVTLSSIVLVFLLFVIYNAFNIKHQVACGCQPAPPPIWSVQNDQLALQNAAGTFTIKKTSVAPQSIVFFYALKTGNDGHLQVHTASVQGDQVTPVDSVVQTLGQIEGVTAGTITVRQMDIQNQYIQLELTLPGQTDPAIQLKPLHQVHSLPKNMRWLELPLAESTSNNKASNNIPVTPIAHEKALPEVLLKGVVYGSDKQQYGYFKSGKTGQKQEDYSYFRLNRTNGELTRITIHDYRQVAGVVDA